MTTSLATLADAPTRLGSHLACAHPRTKVARAACRRARARGDVSIVVKASVSLVKSPENVARVYTRLAAKGCHATVKSGKRAGERCGRPVAHDVIICHAHAKSFKIAL